MKVDNCKAWVLRDEAVIAPFSRLPYYPVAFKKGVGAIIEDVDGNKYIDLLSSAGSQNLGHAHPAIIEAVSDQMKNYTQYTNAYFYNPVAVEFAEALIKVTPGDFHKKVAYGVTGSDGIDGAIKIARAATSRSHIISFERAYHGSTFGAISVSFVSQNMRRKIGPVLSDIYAFSYPNPYRDGDNAGIECIKKLRNAFETWLPPDSVAAVIIEPIQGDGGLVVPPYDFFASLDAMCKEYGILIICDEIQQGCMRTGKWFGIEHFNIQPDIIVTGKAIGGGFPLSAIIARADIIDALAFPGHLFTMGGNAVCCAAGLASLKVMSHPDFLTGVAQRSACLRSRIDIMAQQFSCIGDVRGFGFSIGIEIVIDRKTKKPDLVGTKKICYRGWETGILMIYVAGNVLRIQPPLVITDAEIHRSMDILEACFSDLEHERISDDVVAAVKGW